MINSRNVNTLRVFVLEVFYENILRSYIFNCIKQLFSNIERKIVTTGVIISHSLHVHASARSFPIGKGESASLVE